MAAGVDDEVTVVAGKVPFILGTYVEIDSNRKEVMLAAVSEGMLNGRSVQEKLSQKSLSGI